MSHRDYYDKGAVIHFEVFDDRVEISNPGGLVSAIAEAEFGHRSHSRNPLIFGLFARMHLVEQIGSGIRRIHQVMHEAHLPEPIFRKEGIFVVVLKRPQNSATRTTRKTRGETRGETREKIKKAIEENNQVTTAMLAEILDLTIKGIEYQLSILKKQGILERIGPNKGGYWKINK